MAFYLLQEDGSRIILEDLSGFLILEETSLAPTVDYQGDGKGRAGRRQRRRYRLDELSRSMQATLESVLRGDVDGPEVAVAQAGPVRLVLTTNESLMQAVEQIATATRPMAQLAMRLHELRSLVTDYEAQRRRLIELDDEELWSLV